MLPLLWARYKEMDETQPSQLRSVKEALRPITPTKRPSTPTSPQKRKLVIAACPICQTKMSTLMLPSHASRCKPRRTKPPKPTSSSLHLIFHSPLNTAQFSDDPPTQHHTFTADINLRSFTPPTTLHLHAITPPPHPLSTLPQHSPASRLPVSLLKSALQKSVRRNRPWPAIRIAIVLLRRQAIFELLRRLTIIILEDAILHPAYPSLVFLLAASTKQHILSMSEILHLLQVVYDVADVTSSDPLHDTPNHTITQHQPHHHIVTSIKVRAAYGGMQCDTQLLHRAAQTWHKRSTEQNWRSRFDQYDIQSSVNQVTTQRVSQWLRPHDPVLRPGDIPLEAWDFHCCPVADDILNEITTGKLQGLVPRFQKLARARDTAGVFKGLMWRFWSGVSHKKPLKTLPNRPDAQEKVKDENELVYDVAPKLVTDAKNEEECVWKEELCIPVTEWCKNYRKRYGL